MQGAKCWEKFKGKVNVKALVLVLGFTIYVILISCIFQFWSAFLASYILILTIINGILYVLVSKCNQPASQADGILSLWELVNISKLLRYATAVLSFISLMTTAKGLQDFVFSDDEAWLAYLASFAVQAILICFSLAYCHIYTAIRSVTTLSDRGISLMTGALTVFLAFAFVISSSFSFSYISNNAYAQSWANDSEIMIERYLIQNTSNIAAENKRIGNLLYESIKNSNKSLSEVVGDYISAQNEALGSTVTAFTLSQYDLVSDGTDHGYGLSDDIVESWKTRYSARAIEIDGLVRRFDSCVTDLNSFCNKYNQIATTLDISDAANDDDWESVKTVLTTTYNELTALSQNLTSLISACNGLYSYIIEKDISPYRTALVTAVTNLRDFVDARAKEVYDLKTKVDAAADGYSANSSGTSLPDEIEALQKEIYMLDAVNVSSGSETALTNVDDIINGLSNILATYLNGDILSSEAVAYILELEALVNEYHTYINLANQIEDYINSDLAVTYNITDTKDTDTETSGSVSDVTYDEWVSLRDQDFLQFFSFLKELPSEPDLGEDTFQKEESEELESSSSVNTGSTEYIAEDVLYEANILRRDLLGGITDFERAFNYFKYDFAAMAFFSAFIAAFFDLGAFLTGCFLYGIKHFQKNNNAVTYAKRNKIN